MIKNIIAHHAENVPHLAVKDHGGRKFWTILARFSNNVQKNIVTHHAEGVPHAVKLQIPKNTKNTEKLYKLLKNNET